MLEESASNEGKSMYVDCITKNKKKCITYSICKPETSSFSSAPNSTPEQLQEIRNRLRTSGNNQSAQIGMVLNELADLMTEAAPRMREVASSLRQENQTGEEERNTSRRVLNMSRIVQGMSLINHFLGSVLASADIDSRRSANTPPASTSPRPPVTLPSYIFPRGNTEAIRTPAPSVDTRNATSTDNTTNTAKPKSTLSTNTTPSSSSSNEQNDLKRRIDQVEDESTSEPKKCLKNDKGKDKKD